MIDKVASALDRLASTLENNGMLKEAYYIDIIANTVSLAADFDDRIPKQKVKELISFIEKKFKPVTFEPYTGKQVDPSEHSQEDLKVIRGDIRYIQSYLNTYIKKVLKNSWAYKKGYYWPVDAKDFFDMLADIKEGDGPQHYYSLLNPLKSIYDQWKQESPVLRAIAIGDTSLPKSGYPYKVSALPSLSSAWDRETALNGGDPQKANSKKHDPDSISKETEAIDLADNIMNYIDFVLEEKNMKTPEHMWDAIEHDVLEYIKRSFKHGGHIDKRLLSVAVRRIAERYLGEIPKDVKEDLNRSFRGTKLNRFRLASAYSHAHSE